MYLEYLEYLEYLSPTLDLLEYFNTLVLGTKRPRSIYKTRTLSHLAHSQTIWLQQSPLCPLSMADYERINGIPLGGYNNNRKRRYRGMSPKASELTC